MLAHVLLGFIAISLENILGLLGAILVATTISYAVYTHKRRLRADEQRRTRSDRDTIEQWAAAHGFGFDPVLGKITGAVPDVDLFVTASFDEIEGYVPPTVTMYAVTNYPAGVVMQVAPSWWALSEQVVSSRVTTGDAGFDDRLKTWGDPAEPAQALLTEPIRAALLELRPDELLYDRGVIELRWEDDLLVPAPDSIARLDTALTVVTWLCLAPTVDHAAT